MEFDAKEFFRPDRLKICVFLVMPGVMHLCSYGMGIETEFYYKAFPMIIYLPYMVLSLLPKNPNSQYLTDSYYNGSLVSPVETGASGLMSVMFAYSLSCAVVHIIRKHKK